MVEELVPEITNLSSFPRGIKVSNNDNDTDYDTDYKKETVTKQNKKKKKLILKFTMQKYYLNCIYSWKLLQYLGKKKGHWFTERSQYEN